MNKKEYEERMTKLERELKELKEAEIVDDEFPKYGEQYWVEDENGNITSSYWSDDEDYNYCKDFLRIFKTKEECCRYLEIQEAFKAESIKFVPDWKNHTQKKYYLYYNHNHADNCIIIGATVGFQQATLYFKSEKVLEELIERFGEDDVKKYYFGIEE